MGQTAREDVKVGNRLQICMEHCKKSLHDGPVVGLMNLDNERTIKKSALVLREACCKVRKLTTQSIWIQHLCVLVPVFLSGVLHRKKKNNCGCGELVLCLSIFPPFFSPVLCCLFFFLSLSNKHHELRCAGLMSRCLLSHLEVRKYQTKKRASY